MASQPQVAANIDGYLNPPSSFNQPSYGEYAVNSETGALVSVDGEELLIPAGFTKLLAQPRKCGDHYAELVGLPRSFAGHGPTRGDAIKLAISRAGGAK